MSQKLTELLGFYFMVFQRTPSERFVKCWIDGDDNWVYYDVETIIDFTRKDGYTTVTNKILDCLNTTGIYFWDVSKDTVHRLKTMHTEYDDIQDIIKQKASTLTPRSSFGKIDIPFINYDDTGKISMF